MPCSLNNSGLSVQIWSIERAFCDPQPHLPFYSKKVEVFYSIRCLLVHNVSVHKCCCRFDCLTKISSNLYFPCVNTRKLHTVAYGTPQYTYSQVTRKFNVKMNCNVDIYYPCHKRRVLKSWNAPLMLFKISRHNVFHVFPTLQVLWCITIEVANAGGLPQVPVAEELRSPMSSGRVLRLSKKSRWISRA